MAYDDLPNITDYLPGFSVGQPIKKQAPKQTEPVDYYGKLSPKQKAEVDKEVELANNPRGALGEIGAGIARGATYELPRMVGQALKATGKPGDNAYGAGKWINDVTEGNRTAFMADPDESHHNAVTRAFADAGSMLAPSVAPLATMFIPGVNVAAGTALAAGGGAALFGGAQYQDTFEKAQAAGKTDAEASELGAKTGLIEGLGEGVSNVVMGPFIKGAGNVARKLFGRQVSIPEALETIGNPKFLKEYAKSAAEMAVVETGTEMAQSAGQAAVENAAGIDNTTAWDAATDAIGPSLALTAMLGPLGGFNLRRQQQRNKRLLETATNPDSQLSEVVDASREIATQMEPLVGRDQAMEWRLSNLENKNSSDASRSQGQDDATVANERMVQGDINAALDPGPMPAVPQPVTGRMQTLPHFAQETANMTPEERRDYELAWGRYGGLADQQDLRTDLLSEEDQAYNARHQPDVDAFVNPQVASVPQPNTARFAAMPQFAQATANMSPAEREDYALEWGRLHGLADQAGFRTDLINEVNSQSADLGRRQAGDKGRATQQQRRAELNANLRAEVATHGEEPVIAWRAAATAAGLDPTKVKGQALAKVTQAVKSNDIATMKETLGKLTKHTPAWETLDAYVTELETKNANAEGLPAQNQEGTESQPAAVEDAAVAASSSEAVHQGNEAPIGDAGSVQKGQGEVAPKSAPVERADPAAGYVPPKDAGSASYAFELAPYNSKQPVVHGSNRIWLMSLRDAINDANMVGAGGRPLHHTQKVIQAAKRAHAAIAALSETEKEGAAIHALSTQRLAHLLRSVSFGEGTGVARARAQKMQKEAREEIVVAAILRENGGTKVPTKKQIAEYELDPEEARAVAKLFQTRLENDARNDFELAAAPNYAYDPALEDALKTGDLNATLDHLAANGPSEWSRYMATYLKGLQLDTKIDFVPKAERESPKAGENQSALGSRVFGRYSHRHNAVRIYLGGQNAHTVEHEVVHAATVGRMRLAREAAQVAPGKRTAEQRAAYADMLELYDFYKDMKSKSNGQYAFTNMEEFVAEAFSNERFQSWLHGQSYNGRSAWRKMVDWVMDMLGMRRTPTARNALERAMQTGFKFFEGSRFAAGEGLSFNHSATSAAAAANDAGQALVEKFERFAEKVPAIGNAGSAFHKLRLQMSSKHHIEQSVSSDLKPAVSEMRGADAVKDSILDEMHRGAMRVLKPLDQELARYSGRDRAKMDRLLGKLYGLASQYNVDLNVNFDANKAANPKLNDRLRGEINDLHSQYKSLPQGVRSAADETVRFSRKQYVRTTATFIASRIRAYRNMLGPEAETYLQQLDFRDPSLSEGTNTNPAKFTDVETSNLDKRIQDVLQAVGANNPNATAEQGGTTLGTEMAEYASAYKAQRDSPYSHLGRSGDYFVSFRLPEDLSGIGAVKNVAEKYGLTVGTPSSDNRNVFGRFENRAQAKAFHREIAALGQGVEAGSLSQGSVSDRGSAESMHGGSRFLQAMLRQVDAQDFGPGVTDEMRKFLKRTALDMAPDTSSRNVLQSRNEGGTAGFDAAFAQNFTKRAEYGASMLSNLYTMPMYDQAFGSMQDKVRELEQGDGGTAAKEVMTELKQRHANTLNPVESRNIDLFKSFGYNFYLAMSPAFIITNMMQPYHLTLPYLGGRYGFVQAGKEMVASTKKAVSVLQATLKAGVKEGKEKGGWKGGLIGSLDLDYVLEGTGLRPDEIEFVKRLQASGELSSMQAVELGQVAEGESRDRVLTMKLLSAGSQYTEVVNRISSGLAGYNLERKSENGTTESAVDKGVNTVRDTQYNYTDRNTARAAGRHGLLGKATPLLTSFMNYNLQTIELLWREARTALKGATPKERKAAAKALGGIFVSTSLLAGSLGLPLASVAAAAVDKIRDIFGDDDDDPSDVKTSYRNWLADVFGKDIAEGIARGVPRAALGFDLSSRAGMQDLLPGSRFLADRRDMKEKMESGALGLLGPATSAVSDLMAMMSSMADGRVMDGLTEGLPLALRGAAKAAKMSTDGYTNQTGNKLPLEVTPWDTVVQSLGFTPSKKAEQSEANFSFKQADMQLRATKAKLSNKLYRAVERGEDTSGIMSEVASFNSQHPQYRIEPKRALEMRAKVRGVAEVSGTDILADPRMMPMLEKYKFANTR